MKKKIKLYAYRNIPCKLIDYREDPDHVNASFERAPEWDMEKEIEVHDEPKTKFEREFTYKKPSEIDVPDEPRKPRVFYVQGYIDGSLQGFSSDIVKNEKIIVIEKLPDHIMVSKQNLTDIFYNQAWSPFLLEKLCKELGLGE